MSASMGNKKETVLEHNLFRDVNLNSDKAQIYIPQYIRLREKSQQSYTDA